MIGHIKINEFSPADFAFILILIYVFTLTHNFAVNDLTLILPAYTAIQTSCIRHRVTIAFQHRREEKYSLSFENNQQGIDKHQGKFNGCQIK